MRIEHHPLHVVIPNHCNAVADAVATLMWAGGSYAEKAVVGPMGLASDITLESILRCGETHWLKLHRIKRRLHRIRLCSVSTSLPLAI